ncbi:MAG: WD40 repeat domain-containing protein [Planctomycetes bacterium]|nr:WD40 repeat domain-containing protein [Planctomycetota bacterium]
MKAAFAALTFLVATNVAWAQGKTPVPDVTEQARAQQFARQVYGKQCETARTSDELLAMAKKLLEEAAKIRNDQAGHFVLLQMAKDVAIKAGDAQAALEAVDQIIHNFEVDPIGIRVDCLEAVDEVVWSTSQHGTLAEQAFSVIDMAVADQNFQAATKLAEIARKSAKKAQKDTLLEEISARMKAVKKSQKAHAEHRKAMTTLQDKPTDPAANLVAGRFLCLVKGDWEQGLPMLVLGSDSAFRAVAVQDLEVTASPDAQVALGDSWWDLAGAEGDAEKDSLLLRAGAWYKHAQTKLPPGLNRVKVEQRLNEIAKIGRPATEIARRPWRPEEEAPGVKAVKLFAPETARLLATLEGHTGDVRSLSFSPDGLVLASGSADQTVRLWDVNTGQLRSVLPVFEGQALVVAFSPRGSLLAVADGSRNVSLWDPSRGKCLRTLSGHQSKVWDIAFSPDSSILATVGQDRMLILWDIALGRPPRRIAGHHSWVRAVAISPDGSMVASGHAFEPMKLHYVATGEFVWLPEKLEVGGVYCLAFSPDGSTVASGNHYGTVLLRDVATGKIQRYLRCPGCRTESVAFSPNGSLLVSAGSDDKVRIWDVATGKLRRTFEDFGGVVWSVAFSPDGSLLATASEDRTIKLWGTDPNELPPES